MKKIPYGVSNFKTIIDDGALYIDKTKYIKILEDNYTKYTILLRPRRFGKSLFVSTLWYYYDERFKDEFDNLFGNTFIGKNPTKERNSYRVLFLEFSGIDVQKGVDFIYESFSFNMQTKITSYLETYNYPKELIKEIRLMKDPTNIMRRFFEITQNDKIYLLIDEYDQFANAVLAYDMDMFLKIVGKGGFVRSFYEVLKGATQIGNLHKMFITGVTPITLDSLSSGFNIIKSISQKEKFNELAGFNEEDIRFLIKEFLTPKCPNIDVENLMNQLKKLYNGYKFNIKVENRIYNSTMVNFFLSEFDTKRCEFPARLLDPNVASDYGIIMKLFNIGNREKNFEILNQLITKNEVLGTLKARFDLEKGFFDDDFITLIYSMGFITFKEELFGDSSLFEIPNYMMKVLYFNYFAKEIELLGDLKIEVDIGNILIKLALGDTKPFMKQLETVVKILSNRDFMKFDEKYFHTIALSLLSFATYYYIESQKEIDTKYPDIVVTGRKPFEKKIKYNYMFELKWATDKTFESKKSLAIEELKEYQNLPNIKEIKNLYSYAIIGSKNKVEIIEII